MTQCQLTTEFNITFVRCAALETFTGYVALAALALGYPFALKWPRMSKYIKVRLVHATEVRCVAAADAAHERPALSEYSVGAQAVH